MRPGNLDFYARNPGWESKTKKKQKLFKTTVNGVDRYYPRKISGQKFMEVENRFMMQLLFKAIGVNFTPKEAFINFPLVFGKDNPCEAMRVRAKSKRKVYHMSVGLTVECLVGVLRDNRSETVGWFIEEDKSRKGGYNCGISHYMYL